jgi:Flp pilus assembly protein TadD
LKPDNAEALDKRGEAYEHLGKRDQALADFRAAVALAPEYQDAKEAINRLTIP